jgi:hypothetical protein
MFEILKIDLFNSYFDSFYVVRTNVNIFIIFQIKIKLNIQNCY